MKKDIVVLSLLALILSGSVSAKEMYYGIMLSNVNPEIRGYELTTNQFYSFDNSTSLAGVLGYYIDNNLAVEGKVAINMIGGEVNPFTSSNDDEWGLSFLSVHGVYKGSSKTHLRLKFGFTYAMLDYPKYLSATDWIPENDEMNVSYGIGFGFDTSSGKEFVLEWVQLTDDISAINFGINF